MSGTTRDAQLVVNAPAKINLFFELLAKRPDGFHDVKTVMTTLNLCDTLAFTCQPTNAIDFSAEWSIGISAHDRASTFFGDLPQDASNLVVRALELLKEKTGCDRGATVRLTKRIPSGAGLGGGSSDAAAALVAGNIGWNLGLATPELMELGSRLGSDIPFFLGPAIALCTGRGEKICPLPRMPSMEIVLVRPPESLQTGRVFGQSSVPKSPVALSNDFVEGTIRIATDLNGTLFNRLQRHAAELSPWIQRLENEFSKAPFVTHQMSGSGSTYFGACRTKQDAKRAQQYLRSKTSDTLFERKRDRRSAYIGLEIATAEGVWP